MMIADAQVHIWGADTPERPWPKRHSPHRPVPLGKDELLRAMDDAGVNRVIIVPPGWEGERNDLALEAAQLHPDRFAVMGRLDPERPGAMEELADWRKSPGMLGIRLTFHTEWQRPLLTNGKLDLFWPAAERAGVPVMILVPHQMLHLLEPIVARHPGLRFTMDHLSVPSKTRGHEAFTGLDHLLALARYPNLAVKASGLPSYSVEAYPYRDLQPHLRRVYDAFGPHRIFWGTDYSRLPCSYRQAITLFTEEQPWLNKNDQEWIMGRGLCEWLGWPLPAT
jgi:L-fuconolactonase